MMNVVLHPTSTFIIPCSVFDIIFLFLPAARANRHFGYALF